MLGSKTISDLITDPSLLKAGLINIIDAPVSSGKTHFALTTLPQWAGNPERILYLIDTTNGEMYLQRNMITVSRQLYGLWDYLKNDPDNREANKFWRIDWIGMLPGKRESRRYIGDYTLTQSDVRACGRFDDLVAYGGWPMDDHNPAGFRTSELMRA